MTDQTKARTVQNFVGGAWVDAHTTEFLEVPNPATGEILAHVPLSSRADVYAAVDAASAAYAHWSTMPVPRRAHILFRYQQLLVEHWDELARLITQENGKTYQDAYGEVQRGIENVEFACGAPTLMMGTQLPDIATHLESGTYRYPIGVIGGITPFNFPMMVPCWMFPLAIACGNTFVLKPSERTPLTANRLVELASEAGVPAGVLNVVHGAREAVNGLLEHPGIAAISFVGSQPVAEYVYHTGAAHDKRVQALGGAKNHVIVLPDADIDEAVRGITLSAFGSAGERCMACAVVVAVGEIGDILVERLKQAAEGLQLGNGLEKDVTLGPVIREAHKKRVMSYIESGLADGAVLVCDGRHSTGVHRPGYFLGPTIFDQVTPTMKVWQDEIFGPVLAVVRASDLSEAIALANQSPLANGACLYTNHGGAVRQFRETIDAGMLGINIGVPAPMAFFPFAGWKHSFYGDLHVNGQDGVEFYTHRKVVTSRFRNYSMGTQGNTH